MTADMELFTCAWQVVMNSRWLLDLQIRIYIYMYTIVIILNILASM